MVPASGSCILFCTALLSCLTSGTNVVTKTQTVSIGDVASLECPFGISDLLIVQWSHTVKEIMIHNILSAITNKVGKYTSRYLNESNSAFLEFLVNSTEDVGNYQCVVYSHTATKKTIVWLELDLHHEGRVTNSGEVLASIGEDTHLAWKWKLLTSPSTVVWQHNHEFLVHHVSKTPEKTVGKYTSRIARNGTMMVLEISSVDLDDAGVHSCFSYLRSGAGLKNTWVLQVEGHPHITIKESPMIENETAEAMCCIDYGLPTTNSEIYWSLGASSVRSTTSVRAFHDDENMTICSNFTFVVNKIYHGTSLDCYVRNDLNLSSKGSFFILNVLYTPTVTLIQHESTRKLFYLGFRRDEVLLTCITDGNPEPVVTLQKKTSKSHWTVTLEKPIISSGRSTSTLWNISLKNKTNAIYRCVAVNAIGLEVLSQDIAVNFTAEVANVVLLYTGIIVSLTCAFKVTFWKTGRSVYYRYHLSTDESRHPEVGISVNLSANENTPNDTSLLPTTNTSTDPICVRYHHHERNVYDHAIMISNTTMCTDEQPEQTV